MPNKKFDPRLKAAMREVQAVLQRYDIAGHVVLVSPTHSEFDTHFPTWSLAQFDTNEQGQHGVRFNTKGQTFATEKGKRKAVEASVHMLDQLRHNAVMQFGLIDQVMEMLGEHFEIESNIKPSHGQDLEGEMAARDPRNRPGYRRWGGGGD